MDVFQEWHQLLQVDTYTRAEIAFDLDNNRTGSSVDADSVILDLNSTKWRNTWTSEDVNLEGSSLFIDYIYFKSQEATLGINNFSNARYNISIFPNPVTDVLYITGVEETQLLEILSLTGAVIYQKEISADAGLDIRHIPAGIYFVKMNDNLQGKIVIQ